MFVTEVNPSRTWPNLVTQASIVGTVAVVALAPAATPHLASPADSAARLSAAVLPFDADVLDPAALLTASPEAASAIADVIQNLYLGAEQWVRYGVNLLAWTVGWVPFVGLLGPQINFFYDLGESMVRSAVFNTTDWLTGVIGFGPALNNFGADTVTAFNDFVNAQVNWIHHFLPPPPPIFPLDVGPAEFTDHVGDLGATLPEPGTLVDVPDFDVPDLEGLLSGLAP